MPLNVYLTSCNVPFRVCEFLKKSIQQCEDYMFLCDEFETVAKISNGNTLSKFGINSCLAVVLSNFIILWCCCIFMGRQKVIFYMSQTYILQLSTLILYCLSQEGSSYKHATS